ncbi:two-component system sensor histidine kinase [Lactobacillus hominis DSM 23910 = CRBIP 24.179]|uniref:histidine kinase n=2 Tax=Lactobacillus hominis TaxID=1203033 RepID=I7JVE4_9LACO|nr:two-component system sensor histidine kinase [Lactobacillus hominis DSM 23910 = CRBIP 24.179]CCI82691.1 Possible histidine kinase [Lactobacillus hominis DSM 23910 = CRBIP 24.179]
MLGFLLIIFTSVAIIGYASINFATNQAYEQSYSRLEGYAHSLEQLALSKKNPDGKIDPKFLDNLQVVMQGEDTTLRIFSKDNQMIYPHSPMKWSLPESYFKKMKKGETIQIRNDHQSSQLTFSSKEPYTSVLVPWFNTGKLIGIIWIGSRAQNVESVIVREKHNILNALLITVIVAFILSFILSYFISKRIARLSKATKKVAAGNFNVEIPHGDTDEIDDLARDFNQMVVALKKSSEEIKAQEQRRDQFMADAAHEMRTPLTTINGILEGLQYDAIPEEAKPKSIALMQSETKRLIRLVNENLDFEKIRSNQIMLVKTKFNAAKVLENLTTQMKQKAKDKGDTLKIDCPKELETYADKDRFTQIMVNLVQNALQFTENGTITISGKRLEHASQFKVTDTGIGMNDKQRKFIFDRFYKADPSRAKLGSGESGLGLAIVMSLIKQHGGEITVDSELGIGSTFTVTIYDKGFEKFTDKDK